MTRTEQEREVARGTMVTVGRTHDIEAEILMAVRSLRFGSVEVTVHDSRVVQIECKSKIRFQPGG